MGRLAGHTAADDREESQAWQREGTRDAGLVTPGRERAPGMLGSSLQAEGNLKTLKQRHADSSCPPALVLCPLSLGAESKPGEP